MQIGSAIRRVTEQARAAAAPTAIALLAAVALQGAVATAAATPAGAAPASAVIAPPEQGVPLPTAVGRGEGALDLVAWTGYAQPQWVTPFEHATGCRVTARYAGSSREMAALMAKGGGGRYDVASVDGDAALGLVYDGDVKPVNVALIPGWDQLRPFLKSPVFNTVAGKHYGVSYQFGPTLLLYRKTDFRSAPVSWSVLYDPAHKGKVTVPDDPMQIADAALYLSTAQPSLGITDPYEITRPQFNAAVALLTQQKPLVKAYWDLPSQETALLSSGAATLGAGWPYQAATLKAAKVKVAATIPPQGTTGWADTWMLATHAPHPNCAYRWLQWVTTPRVQAEQAVYFGETPANPQACSTMNQLQPRSCVAYRAGAPDTTFKAVRFWRTPLTQCDNGSNACVPFQDWVAAWARIAAQ
jgi:putative spermidine/putrescine transport system substrate-binding protein